MKRPRFTKICRIMAQNFLTILANIGYILILQRHERKNIIKF